MQHSDTVHSRYLMSTAAFDRIGLLQITTTLSRDNKDKTLLLLRGGEDGVGLVHLDEVCVNNNSNNNITNLVTAGPQVQLQQLVPLQQPAAEVEQALHLIRRGQQRGQGSLQRPRVAHGEEMYLKVFV